jgi:effector-binding domain-containing protein
MSYEITVRRLEPQAVMSVRGKTRFARLAQTIGEFLTEVWNHVQESGGTSAGPPFTRYHAVIGEEIDLEAGLPVAAPVGEGGRIRAGQLPGGEAVSTVHVGPYELLPQAGAALDEWVERNRREAAGPNWELYWTDPGAEPDPLRWKTEVVKPLRAP